MIINFLFFEYAQSLRVNAFFAEQILYTHSLWWIANWIRHWKAWSALHILLYEWNSSYNDTCFFVCAFSWHLKCVYVIMWLRNETCRRLLLFAQFWVARNKKQNNKTKFLSIALHLVVHFVSHSNIYLYHNCQSRSNRALKSTGYHLR